MKISRRTMLAGSAAAVTAPVLATVLARRGGRRRCAGGRADKPTRTAAQTAATVSFSIQNNTGSDTVYAFVTGQALDNGNALMLLEADGRRRTTRRPRPRAGSPLGGRLRHPAERLGRRPGHDHGARSWRGPGCGFPSARR